MAKLGERPSTIVNSALSAGGLAAICNAGGVPCAQASLRACDGRSLPSLI